MENCGFMEESWTLSSNPVSSLDQHAKKVVSDSQGPVDFVIGLVDSDSVFFGNSILQNHSRQMFFNFQLNVFEPKAIFQADPTK